MKVSNYETRPADVQVQDQSGSSGRLPDFIIAGFPKCGTSSVRRNLSLHPEIHMSRGEVHYFLRNKLTPEEYRALFSSEKKCVGEKSTNYFYGSSTMKKMHRCVPQVKLVACIRHPIHMLHSFYNYRVVRHGKEPSGFDPKMYPFARILLEKMSVNGLWEEAADYAAHLEQNVLSLYAKRQLLVVVQERLVNRPQQTYQELQEWLGVKPEPNDNLVANSHSAGDAYYPTIDYSSPRYRQALSGLIERYRPRIAAIRGLLGERIPEWDAFDDFYRSIAAGDRPATAQLSILGA